MKIGLLDMDSKMANIPLMKISSYHKSLGDEVKWYDGQHLDKLYVSKIFNFSNEKPYIADCEVIKGGTGYDLHSKLPEKIDNIKTLDYSIYPECDYSMQFFSRGCVNKCNFCVVREKEGYIYPTEPFDLNPNGKHIEVLDNNFFANPEWKSAAEQLIVWKQPVNFHGVDIRIMNEEQAFYLNKIKRYKQIHIAWDSPYLDLEPKLREVTKYLKPYKLMCYVLIGFNSTQEQDIYRVKKLRELKIDCFVMKYKAVNGEKLEDLSKRCGFTDIDQYLEYTKDFARWSGRKELYKAVKWEEYNPRKGGRNYEIKAF